MATLALKLLHLILCVRTGLDIGAWRSNSSSSLPKSGIRDRVTTGSGVSEDSTKMWHSVCLFLATLGAAIVGACSTLCIIFTVSDTLYWQAGGEGSNTGEGERRTCDVADDWVRYEQMCVQLLQSCVMLSCMASN